MKVSKSKTSDSVKALERMYRAGAADKCANSEPKQAREVSRDEENVCAGAETSSESRPRDVSVLVGVVTGVTLGCIALNSGNGNAAAFGTVAPVARTVASGVAPNTTAPAPAHNSMTGSVSPPEVTAPVVPLRPEKRAKPRAEPKVVDIAQIDPHTIEGTAAIHEIMQSGKVHATKSSITGVVDSDTMTASLYWTFHLKNRNTTDKEASIIMALPDSAALSRATLWINGVPQEASFSSNSQVQNAYDSIVVRHRDPLLVTQVGPNRVKILAAPVTANGGKMKFRIGITVPVQPGQNGSNFIAMPQIIKSNLTFDSKQSIHLTSVSKINGPGKIVRSGDYILNSNIPVAEMGKIKISVEKPREEVFAARLTHTNPPEFVQAKVVEGRLALSRVGTNPQGRIITDNDAAFRLSNLWARQQIESLAASGSINEACNVANVFRIVSSVSGATVLEETYDYSNNGLNRDMYRTLAKTSSTGDDFTTVQGFVPYSAEGNTSAPVLQGATNGTIGPQGGDFFSATGSQTMQSGTTTAPQLLGLTNGGIGPQGADATVIQGVNTSGTVRVNNLANLEALLNVVVNLIEIIGISLSAFLLSESMVNNGLRAPIRLSRFKTAILASFVAALAISVPGMVNMTVCWMRDCNLFS